MELLEFLQAYILTNKGPIAVLLLSTLIIGGPLSAYVLDTFETIEEPEEHRVWTLYALSWIVALSLGFMLSGLGDSKCLKTGQNLAILKTRQKIEYDKKIEIAILKGKDNVKRRK